MYYDVSSIEPSRKPKTDVKRSLLISLAITSALVCSISAGIFGYHYFHDNNNKINYHRRCPKKWVTFEVNTPKIENELWAYATFWSLPQFNQTGNATSNSTAVAKFAPLPVLENLEIAFKPLSLLPLERLPYNCRRKPCEHIDPEQIYNFSGGNEVMHFADNDFFSIHELFSADLKSEFQFQDNVLQTAQKIIKQATRVMASRNMSFDNIIPLYISDITPDLEKQLGDANFKDIEDGQLRMISNTMDDYRHITRPMFLVLGNSSWVMPILKHNDVVVTKSVPDEVALAIMSTCSDIIFNHGLWPTFGALLNRSNAASYAMNSTVLDAAKNASLNWVTAVMF